MGILQRMNMQKIQGIHGIESIHKKKPLLWMMCLVLLSFVGAGIFGGNVSAASQVKASVASQVQMTVGTSQVQMSVMKTSQLSQGVHPTRLVDEADLLTSQEKQELQALLDQVSEERQCDVVVVTVESLNGAGIQSYTDDYFDANGYGIGNERDGILFLLAMNEREWAISTRGFGITAFTDAGQEYLMEKLLPDLKNGDYQKTFTAFAEHADDFLKQARAGKPYDRKNLPGVQMRKIALSVVVGLIGGFLLALFGVWRLKKEMRPVYAQVSAENYLVQNSCHIREQRERLIRKEVHRTHIPKEQSDDEGSSVHESSSGATHGGSHGKF